MADEIIVLITASSDAEASTISHALVNEHLAACVNIIPAIHSVFFWDGKTQESSEVLLIGKSRRQLIGKIISRVRMLHSYSVPEIIALPIIAGSPDYLEWIQASTKD